MVAQTCPHGSGIPFDSDTVFVLGAGFSRAITKGMPLTNDLGEPLRQAVASLPLPPELSPDRFLSSAATIDVESWMSFLAEDHPFHDDEQRGIARSALARTINTIVSEIATSQWNALPQPEWLLRFASHLSHHIDPNPPLEVLTFNWDTLLEQAVAQQPVGLAVPSGNLLGMPDLRSGDGQGDLFGSWGCRIRKLHGGINLFAYEDGGSSSLNTVYYGHHPTQRGDKNSSYLDSISTYMPGMRSLVVPPVALKGRLLQAGPIRGGWVAARSALSTARSVVSIGYSLPTTDTSATGLFATINPEARLVLVTQEAGSDSLAARYAHFSSSPRIETCTCGVAEFMDTLLREADEVRSGVSPPARL